MVHPAELRLLSKPICRMSVWDNLGRSCDGGLGINREVGRPQRRSTQTTNVASQLPQGRTHGGNPTYDPQDRLLTYGDLDYTYTDDGALLLPAELIS